jgi:hypothetical protein
MRGITAPVLAILAVLYTLIVLLSADRTPSGPASVKNQERISDLWFGLIETIMLHRRQTLQTLKALKKYSRKTFMREKNSSC